MLNKIHLVDIHGGSYPSAVLQVYQLETTELTQAKKVTKSFAINDNDWSDDEEVEDATTFIEKVRFRVKYWDSMDNKAQGKLHRKLIADEEYNDWFEFEFTDEDAQKFNDGFNESATTSQKIAAICDDKVKNIILPSFRG